MPSADVTRLWDVLGSFWENFEDKPVVESFWYGLASGIDAVHQLNLETQKSRSLEYMSPTIDCGPETYFLVYSGITTDLTEDLTVELLASGGMFSYQVDDWTYSIPEITSIYKYQGTTYSDTYYEDTDYTLSGMNHIIWGNTPPVYDLRFGTKGVLVGYARHVYRLNPVLMNVWARNCGFTYDDFASYSTYGNVSYDHLKMLVWALITNRMRGPSIKTLKDAFGISRGMPFAYNAGELTSATVGDHKVITIGTDSYTLPSGMVPIPNGTVAKFDIIASGLNLWDYVTNSGLVNGYSNSYNRRNTLVYQVDSTVSGLSYSHDFHDAYVSGLMPVQLQHFII